MHANGETRRFLALAALGAFVGAVCTKLGEWSVEELRKRAGRAPAATDAKEKS